MKKSIFLLLAFCIIATSNTFAQTENKWTGFIELQPTFNVDGAGHSIGILGGATRSVNQFVSVGGAIGAYESFSFEGTPIIPIMFRTKIEKETTSISPYLTLDLGYGLNTNDFGYGSIIVNPTVGARFGKVYLGVGYYAAIPTDSKLKTGNNINVKLGFILGGSSSDSKFVRFLKRTHVTFEAGYGFGLNTKKYTDNFKTKLGDNISAKLVWDYDITENWLAGIGSGAIVSFDKDITKRSSTKTDKDGTNHTYEYEDKHTETGINIPLFARGKYTMFDSSKKIRPFVLCDVGYIFHPSNLTDFDKSGLFIEPQIGTNFGRFSASIGYLITKNKTKYYSYSDRTTVDYNVDASSLNIRLGVRF